MARRRRCGRLFVLRLCSTLLLLLPFPTDDGEQHLRILKGAQDAWATQRHFLSQKKKTEGTAVALSFVLSLVPLGAQALGKPRGNVCRRVAGVRAKLGHVNRPGKRLGRHG